MSRTSKPPRPTYEIRSVDSALRLIQLLRDQGTVRLSDAAHQLAVAPSTAHRLLQMLVYRGFAIQDDRRGYRPGPGLLAPVTQSTPMSHLRSRAQPILELLAQSVGETVNLQVRVGTTVRVLDSVEATVAAVQVGDRRGIVLDAAAASGGVALLSLLDEGDLTRLYRSNMAKTMGVHLNDNDFLALTERLRHVRIAGWALNLRRTEDDVVAIGAPVKEGSGRGIAAVSISVPATRAQVVEHPPLRSSLLRACADIESALIA